MGAASEGLAARPRRKGGGHHAALLRAASHGAFMRRRVFVLETVSPLVARLAGVSRLKKIDPRNDQSIMLAPASGHGGRLARLSLARRCRRQNCRWAFVDPSLQPADLVVSVSSESANGRSFLVDAFLAPRLLGNSRLKTKKACLASSSLSSLALFRAWIRVVTCVNPSKP